MDKKKILKLLGGLLSLLAVLFIIKKCINLDVDVNLLFRPKTIFIIVILALIQVFIILTATYPWLMFVKILSGERIAFKDAMVVFAKANIFKYIPGNVFQFVARNELAVRKKISHVDVAMATLLDTVFNLLVAFILSICLLGQGAIEYLKSGVISGKIIALGVILLLILIIAVFCVFRDKFSIKLKQYRGCFTASNFVRFFKANLYYIFNNVMNGVMLVIVLDGVFGTSYQAYEMRSLIGAYLLAVIIGMVTPGASGGIGIRETVMLLLTQNLFSESVIVSAMVLLRIALIIADILAYFIQMVLSRLLNVEEIAYERD